MSLFSNGRFRLIKTVSDQEFTIQIVPSDGSSDGSHTCFLTFER